MREKIRSKVLTFLKQHRDWALTTDVAKATQHPRQTVIKYLRALYGEGLAEWRKVGKANFWRPTKYLLAGKKPIKPQKTGEITCPFCQNKTPDYDLIGKQYRCSSCNATYIYAFEDQIADIFGEAELEDKQVKTVLVNEGGNVKIYAAFMEPEKDA